MNVPVDELARNWWEARVLDHIVANACKEWVDPIEPVGTGMGDAWSTNRVRVLVQRLNEATDEDEYEVRSDGKVRLRPGGRKGEVR